MSFPFRPPQNTEWSSLCSAVGPRWLSILYMVVCICPSQSPNSSCVSFPLGVYRFVLCQYLCFWLVNKVINTIFLDSTCLPIGCLFSSFWPTKVDFWETVIMLFCVVGLSAPLTRAVAHSAKFPCFSVSLVTFPPLARDQLIKVGAL